tara:strand:- start:129 stop:266 length:138 start_codon:yes stop_codon:yes gene_type:complete
MLVAVVVDVMHLEHPTVPQEILQELKVLVVVEMVTLMLHILQHPM